MEDTRASQKQSQCILIALWLIAKRDNFPPLLIILYSTQGQHENKIHSSFTYFPKMVSLTVGNWCHADVYSSVHKFI